MSTELAELSGGELSSDILARLESHTEEERGRIGNSGAGTYIRVNTRSNTFVLPDGNEVETFEALIVNFAYSNSYYLGAFNPKVITPPACFALSPTPNNMVASSNSPIIQNEEGCAGCQQNQFGSATQGNGKACKNEIVIAVLPPDPAVIRDHDIWVLKISPTALTAFNKYASSVTSKKIPDSEYNYPLGLVRTQFFFDPNSQYATVRFKEMNPEPNCLDVVLDRKEEAMNRLLEEPDVSSFVMPDSK